MTEQVIRKVLGEHAKLSVDSTALDPAADLYELGLDRKSVV